MNARSPVAAAAPASPLVALGEAFMVVHARVAAQAELVKRAGRITERLLGEFPNDPVHGFYDPARFVASCQARSEWKAKRREILARLEAKVARALEWERGE